MCDFIDYEFFDEHKIKKKDKLLEKEDLKVEELEKVQEEPMTITQS